MWMDGVEDIHRDMYAGGAGQERRGMKRYITILNWRLVFEDGKYVGWYRHR